MLKIVYPICCGIDIHKSFWLHVLHPQMKKELHPIKSDVFPYSLLIFAFYVTGFLLTVVKMSVWNQLENIRFLCAMF